MLLWRYRQVTNACPVAIFVPFGKVDQGSNAGCAASVFCIKFVAGRVFLNHGDGVFAIEPAAQIHIGAMCGAKGVAIAVRQLLANGARHGLSKGGDLVIAHGIVISLRVSFKLFENAG